MFRWELADQLGDFGLSREVLRMLAGDEALHMTRLGLNMSVYVNGVARRHQEVSRTMFPDHAIGHVTNGVHSLTWTARPMRDLYDGLIPGWREDPACLRLASGIRPEVIWEAHLEAKRELLEEVRRRTGRCLGETALTIGFARRMTGYKRASLVFRDLVALRGLADGRGEMQIVFAGKAHPRDHEGKAMIRSIHDAGRVLGESVPVVYVPEYDLRLAKLLVSGVDLWLNTPRAPFEASGTSGMKAAHNGVPSLSVLDGWWLEGHVEGVTGWSIGGREVREAPAASVDSEDARSLYEKLATILALYHCSTRSEWMEVMRQTIALNASFFNTHRMIRQYSASAYIG